MTPHPFIQSPQGVTDLHAPLLTAEVPGANPGVGTFILSRSTSGTDEKTFSKTSALLQRPECDSMVLR